MISFTRSLEIAKYGIKAFLADQNKDPDAAFRYIVLDCGIFAVKLGASCRNFLRFVLMID